MREKSKYKKKPTVLIVDDSVMILAAEQSLFCSLGCKVLIAKNASEALCLINNKIDFVLTDIQMPEMSGDKLAKEIHRKYPAMRIFGITSMTSSSASGIDRTDLNELLAKPLKVEACEKLISMARKVC